MEEKSRTHLARVLRELREAKGWSQPELSKLSGVNQRTISKLEKGTLSDAFERIRKLAHALGVSAAYLFGEAPGKYLVDMAALRKLKGGAKHLDIGEHLRTDLPSEDFRICTKAEYDELTKDLPAKWRRL